MQTVQTWKSFRDLKWVQGSRKTVPHRRYSLKELQQGLRRRQWERQFKKWMRWVFFFNLCEPYSNTLIHMSSEGEICISWIPGDRNKKRRKSNVFLTFSFTLLLPPSVIKLQPLISPWLINDDSHRFLLCLADSDTTRVAHVFLFSACNQTQRKTKTWYEVHYRWTCLAVIHTLPGEQSSSVSALGKRADKV